MHLAFIWTTMVTTTQMISIPSTCFRNWKIKVYFFAQEIYTKLYKMKRNWMWRCENANCEANKMLFKEFKVYERRCSWMHIPSCFTKADKSFVNNRYFFNSIVSQIFKLTSIRTFMESLNKSVSVRWDWGIFAIFSLFFSCREKSTWFRFFNLSNIRWVHTKMSWHMI
jgi:hypothetical protein